MSSSFQALPGRGSSSHPAVPREVWPRPLQGEKEPRENFTCRVTCTLKIFTLNTCTCTVGTRKTSASQEMGQGFGIGEAFLHRSLLSFPETPGEDFPGKLSA